MSQISLLILLFKQKFSPPQRILTTNQSLPSVLISVPFIPQLLLLQSPIKDTSIRSLLLNILSLLVLNVAQVTETTELVCRPDSLWSVGHLGNHVLVLVIGVGLLLISVERELDATACVD